MEFNSPKCNISRPTSLYSQKDTSACELVVSAAGSNICTLTLRLDLLTSKLRAAFAKY